MMRMIVSKSSNHQYKIEKTIMSSIDTQKTQRQPHAIMELASRLPKARKIEQLMAPDLFPSDNPIQLLEIGCGSGGISHFFGTHQSSKYIVTAIDIHDNRQVSDGYTFLKVQDTKLPFHEHSFDFIITNHVIEHVGEKSDQIQHLKEIYRVLKPTGHCYLAVPNRWAITEPHYQLKFLSWLPHSLRSRYLQFVGKGSFYDCEPLAMFELEEMLTQTGFLYENMSVLATRITFDLEKPNATITKILRNVPDYLINWLKPAIPTLIYKLRIQDYQGHYHRGENTLSRSA
jgi:SAM-dependent methyltransferase